MLNNTMSERPTIAYPHPHHRSAFLAEGNIGTACLTLLAMLLSVFIYGKMYDLLGSAAEDVRALAIFLTVGIAMAGAAICLWRGMIFSSVLTIAGLGWVFFYTLVYSLNTGVPYTFSAGGEFIGYTFFGLFALTLRDKKFGQLMWWFYIISCAYALYYVMASLAVQAGAINIASTTRAVVGADDASRGNRLIATLLPLTFGIMYTLVQVFYRFKIRYLILLAVFVVSWYFTFSRAASATVIIVIFAYAVCRNIRLVSRILFLVLAGGTLFSISLIWYPEYNPFYLTYDISGMIRVMSVDTISQLFKYYTLFGSGIAYGPEAYTPITGTKFFYPGDVGLLGMLFCYGLFGFPVYLYIMYVGFKAYANTPQETSCPNLGIALTLTGCVFGLYSLQSPQYDSGSPASVLGMAFVALALSRRAKSGILNAPQA